MIFQPPVRVGEIVAEKYRVDHVLGEGGMGVVVAATHVHLGQHVALKFLLPELATRPDLVQRFLREARAAVQIHSEHVARVLDVGAHNGVPFMVMEYLEGEDLSHVIAARGPIVTPEAVGYVLEACEAIAEAHSLGIVHRDLKPPNLFLARRPSGKPTVKVLDFGISKSAGTADGIVTNASTIMGSPSYMSPEQLVASATVDVRTDIWALGVVLYELVSRSLPFNANTMPELVAVILAQPPQPIVSTQANIPPELRVVIDRCLEKDRERRFANVAELAQALAPFAPRHAESVQRTANVLGLGPPSSRAPAMSLPRAGARNDQPTFSPTTTNVTSSHSPLLLIVPAVIAVAALVAVIVMLKARPQASSPSANTSVATLSSSSPSATPPLITADPTPLALVATSSAPVASISASPIPGQPRTHHVGAASASASIAAPSASCHTESFFDDKGQKHFKYTCP